MLMTKKTSSLDVQLSKFNRGVSIAFIVFGILGIIASFALTVDKITLLQNPNFQPVCNINPVFSCTSVMNSKPADSFGIPNTIFGLIGYTAVVTTGFVMLAGGTMRRWFWLAFGVGQLLAVSFIHYLFYQSIFNLGTICLFCMLSWFSTIPIFWYALIYNLRNNHLRLPKQLQSVGAFLQSHHLEGLFTWYAIIICTIMYQFWYYWQTLLP
jgi:uncharacterized membrane protein